MLSVYKMNVEEWNELVCYENVYFEKFTELMEEVKHGHITLEEAGDDLRLHLHNVNEIEFPVVATENGTDIFQLCIEMLMQPELSMTHTVMCTKCDIVLTSEPKNMVMWHCVPANWKKSAYTSGSYRYASLQSWIPVMLKQPLRKKCSQCQGNLEGHTTYHEFPSFIAFEVGRVSLKFDTVITLQEQKYRLCGIIYHGGFHFTSRIISDDGSVLRYDGMNNRGTCQYEGQLDSMGITTLHGLNGRSESVAMYYKI